MTVERTERRYGAGLVQGAGVGKTPDWKYFGRVERKESGSTDVPAKTARLLPRFGLECFPSTDLRSFSIWLHSAADHRAHI